LYAISRAFSLGKIASDDGRAPGVEIGRPSDIYRRVRIDSRFGKITVLATDGHLPYPYGREIAGYEVSNLSETLSKAKAAGATVLVEPYVAGKRRASMVEFPGGYIAEKWELDRLSNRAHENQRVGWNRAMRPYM
jgi:hypothetical protein